MSELPSIPINTARKKRRRKLSPLVADARLFSGLLGVGVRSIRTWDSAGMLPRPVRIGSRVVWVISEIREWLAAGAPDRDTWDRLKQAQQPRKK